MVGGRRRADGGLRRAGRRLIRIQGARRVRSEFAGVAGATAPWSPFPRSREARVAPSRSGRRHIDGAARAGGPRSPRIGHSGAAIGPATGRARAGRRARPRASRAPSMVAVVARSALVRLIERGPDLTGLLKVLAHGRPRGLEHAPEVG